MQIEIKPTNEDNGDDLFADIFENDEQEIKPIEEKSETFQKFDNNEQKINVMEEESEPVEKFEELKNDLTENTSEKMKQSDQLLLKVYSKYMEPSTSKSSKSGKYHLLKLKDIRIYGFQCSEQRVTLNIVKNI